MIIGKLAKVVLKLIMPDIIEHFVKVFKSDRVLNYVEEPNELDMGLDALKDMVISQQREIDEISKLIKRGK